MRTALKLAAAALLIVPMAVPARADDVRPTPREGADFAVPLFGAIVAGWDAPDDDPFAPGHRGVDVAADAGTPVRASASGVVSFAGTVVGNRTVSVDHAGGVRTSYSYLGSLAVKKGQAVALGDVIGAVGTGHPDEDLPPHVHISVRRDGVYVDPVGLYVGSSSSDLLSLVA